MSGHTPGPWSYRDQPYDDWGIVRAGRYVICQVRDPNVTDDDLSRARREGFDPYEANARLTAAAPELLNAVEAVFGVSEAECLPKGILDQLSDAAAKARGEVQ